MQIRKIAYAAFVGVAAVAFVIGSAVPSEAAKKKKAAAAAPPAATAQWPTCWGAPYGASLREKGQPDVQLHQCLLCHEGRRFRRKSWRLQASKGWRKEKRLNYLLPQTNGPLLAAARSYFVAFLA